MYQVGEPACAGASRDTPHHPDAQSGGSGPAHETCERAQHQHTKTTHILDGKLDSYLDGAKHNSGVDVLEAGRDTLADALQLALLLGRVERKRVEDKHLWASMAISAGRIPVPTRCTRSRR